MKYIDGHCDVLWKMYERQGKVSFYDPASPLDVTYDKAIAANYFMQTFAVFVPPHVPRGGRLHAMLAMIDMFYERIVGDGSKVTAVTSYGELAAVARQEGKIAALLHLEGADALEGELYNLRTVARLGVRSIGLTWNWANEVADGVEEARGGGLTRFGRQFVREMARLSVLLDVAHLSERGFWDVLELGEPLAVYTSHGNARRMCSHPRNLDDAQIKAIIARGGVIGLTFVPWFVDDRCTENDNRAQATTLLKHIDHICSLGGEHHVAFGSDFDGFTPKMDNLIDASDSAYLREMLLKHYSEAQVKRFMSDNWLRFYHDFL
ncbi:dipeptidase [Numidum massiliense]|uniref:dipeptidase n=1 Tax=Numidum massiliense TaxID=1522315 RepID=UPI0006D534DF|nr:dipeptidase [Numidum massiliense]